MKLACLWGGRLQESRQRSGGRHNSGSSSKSIRSNRSSIGNKTVIKVLVTVTEVLVAKVLVTVGTMKIYIAFVYSHCCEHALLNVLIHSIVTISLMKKLNREKLNDLPKVVH